MSTASQISVNVFGPHQEKCLREAARKPKSLNRCKCKRVKIRTAEFCLVCSGAWDEVDQLMAAERGITVEELREAYKRK